MVQRVQQVHQVIEVQWACLELRDKQGLLDQRDLPDMVEFLVRMVKMGLREHEDPRERRENLADRDNL